MEKKFNAQLNTNLEKKIWSWWILLRITICVNICFKLSLFMDVRHFQYPITCEFFLVSTTVNERATFFYSVFIMANQSSFAVVF